ncbi:phosphatidylglycerol lysyltransferase domain-containing protein [Desulfobotulus sp. H1]|uniref:Phosphatidylglycerol lysyltransferase domain-containing protein n=1 Tax=Desulfobotulus pelophilus TaxID=2823377 RepID=A0ABT3NAM4_9BACT|nr:phosphatidylglycerol lysyltransferase domain-containing protein [Desulfobotulus pelophilus]MCW7754512.1 phosphatidylglycerol lysyltransferase domain-containing protein [Desulfobotulus pelophilus]
MKFQTISLQDYDRLSPYFTNQTYPLCSYSLPSLLSWQTKAYHPVAAFSRDSLIIGADYAHQPELRHLILPLGKGKKWQPEELRDLCRESRFPAFWFAPESWIKETGKEALETFFLVEEQSAYADYIYLKEDLATLKGRKYAKKRNLISQFQRTYSEDRIEIRPITTGDIPECLTFLEEWCRERKCDRDPETDMACEKIAAANAIEMIDHTDYKGLKLSLDGNLVAFGIANRLTSDMGVLHFEKALGSIKGLYQYFDKECCARLFSPDIHFINKESDMDEPGLAHAKSSYHPVRRERSFVLTPKAA